MVVARAVGDDDVRLPLADQRVICWRFSSVGISSPSWMSSTCGGDAQHLVAHAADLRRAALGERAAGLLPVADVAVGDGDELHVMPEPRPLRRGAAGLELRIVGMSAEDDDAQLAVGILGECDGMKTGREAQEARGDTERRRGISWLV